MHFFRVWKQLTKNAFSTFLSNRIDSWSYFLGKLIRFIFFLLLIYSLFDHTATLGGYNRTETLLFFLTFNVVDVLSQFFFRGIYMFKWEVERGAFDGVLTKPVNALFYSLTRLTDLLDFFFFLPIVGIVVYTLSLLPALSFEKIFLYVFLIFVGFIIILAIHILSAAIMLRTNESDNLLWLYRETVALGRFPPEILSSKLQLFFTYILPIIVVVAFPVKALLGRLSVEYIILAVSLAFFFFLLSIIFWKHSLKKYSSASS